jgi:hypothetical protein
MCGPTVAAGHCVPQNESGIRILDADPSIRCDEVRMGMVMCFVAPRLHCFALMPRTIELWVCDSSPMASLLRHLACVSPPLKSPSTVCTYMCTPGWERGRAASTRCSTVACVLRRGLACGVPVHPHQASEVHLQGPVHAGGWARGHGGHKPLLPHPHPVPRVVQVQCRGNRARVCVVHCVHEAPQTPLPGCGLRL